MIFSFAFFKKERKKKAEIKTEYLNEKHWKWTKPLDITYILTNIVAVPDTVTNTQKDYKQKEDE